MMTRTGSAAGYSPIRAGRQRSSSSWQTNPEHEHEHQHQQESALNLPVDYRSNSRQARRQVSSSSPTNQPPARNPESNEEPEQSSQARLEEVYVCNCCCLTRELRPAVRFMSSFKCAFFLANFLVFAFGLANFGMGLWFRIDPKVYEIHKYIETQNFTIAGWLMLFCGFTACLVSLLGFVGAARETIALLVLYFTIVVALTLAFVGTLVLLTVYGLGSSLEYFIVKEIYEQMRRRAMNTEVDAFLTADATQFMDFIQVKMRCCGAADFRDYLKLGMSVPTTCYTIDKNYVSAPGCGHSIRQLLDLRAGLATGFTLASIIAQLFAIIASALIFCSLYHFRATPKAGQVPGARPEPRLETVVSSQQQVPRLSSSSRDYSLSSNLHRPRSRTPIVI